MAFTLGKFVRQTPVAALREYFHWREIDLGGEVDWTKGERALLKALTAAIEQLDGLLRQLIYQDFERVDELADEVGERAIVSAFPNPAMAITLFEDMEGTHSRCLWLLVNHGEMFERAEDIRFSAYYRFSRTWSGFVGPKGMDVDRSPLAKDGFVRLLQKLFRRVDGSGRAIEIDVFDRWADAEDDTNDRLVQVTAYLEGLPASGSEFDDEGLSRRVRRPALETAITYDRNTGAIDVVARGGKRVREDVARIFLVSLLGVDGDQIAAMRPSEYDLTSLARRRPFDSDPLDRIESVEVVRLRLRPYSRGTSKLTIEAAPGGRQSVYDLAESWFEGRNPLRSGFTVEHSRLAITFRREQSSRHPKRLYVELTRPNGCNLKDRTQPERLIGDKYLVAWGLVKETGKDARSA
jgi:hypothetical protein